MRLVPTTPADLRLTFRIEGTEQVARTLQGLAGAVKDLTPAFSEIARDVIFPSITMNFASQGRPTPWRPLSAEYAKKKARVWGPRPILVAGGTLVSAFSGPGASEFVETNAGPSRLQITLKGSTIGRTGLFYGIFHTSQRPRAISKRGREKLPRRQFFMVQEEDVPNIVEVIQRYIMRHAPRSWRMFRRGRG